MVATLLFSVALGVLMIAGIVAVIFDRSGNTDAVIQTCQIGIASASAALVASATPWKRIKEYVIKQN